MQTQLKERGINYERIPGVYGKTYAPTKEEYDAEAAVLKTEHALLRGEIGCALSHVAAYKKIIAAGLPFTLILEDDVALPRDFKARVQEMIARQPTTDFEYLLFDYVPVGLPYLKQWVKGVLRNTQSRWRISPLESIRFFLYALIKMFYIVPLCLFEGWRDRYSRTKPGPVRFFRPVYFAGAYLVTLRGAEKLLALAEPVIYTADQLPNRARLYKQLRFFCYAPRIVGQEKERFGSSILDLSGEEIYN